VSLSIASCRSSLPSPFQSSMISSPSLVLFLAPSSACEYYRPSEDHSLMSQYHRSFNVHSRHMAKREDSQLVDPHSCQRHPGTHWYLHHGRWNIRFSRPDQRRYQLGRENRVSDRHVPSEYTADDVAHSHVPTTRIQSKGSVGHDRRKKNSRIADATH
jgi:hypothetical protein